MENKEYVDVVVDVWGPLACFTTPENKVERMTYPCITPGAARNILNRIFFKRTQCYYEITKIEILNKLEYFNILKNELKSPVKINDSSKEGGKVAYSPPNDNNFDYRTQRNSFYIKNPAYRIYAKLTKRPDSDKDMKAISKQFFRRLEKGQCFSVPYLGTSDCIAYFSPPDYSKKPVEDFNLIIQNMLYDCFDIDKNIPLTVDNKEEVLNVSFFDAKIMNGVMKVPSFFSDEIRRKQHAT